MRDDPRRWFWRRTRQLTAVLLLAWLALNLAATWFARELSALTAFGFPLGYWLAAEGALGVYLLIIVVYVVAMDRLEARYLDAVDEDDAALLPAAGEAAVRPAAAAPRPAGR